MTAASGSAHASLKPSTGLQFAGTWSPRLPSNSPSTVCAVPLSRTRQILADSTSSMSIPMQRASMDQAPNPYGGRGPEILGVSWSLMGLATVLLSLRVVVQVSKTKDTVRGRAALVWAWAAWVSIATVLFASECLATDRPARYSLRQAWPS